MEQLAFGAVQKNISGTSLLSTLFPVPQLLEQQAIAEALSDFDALINSLNQLITKKRNIKQGAMQQLLTGKTRLPGFTDKWEPKMLGDIFDFRNGLNKEKRYFGTGTPIVNYVDVYTKRGLTFKDIEGRVTVTNSELKAYNVRKDDVFFTRTSETVEEIGLTSVILEDLENTVFSGFILRARPKNNLLTTSYKKYCFSTEAIRKEITSKSSYTTRALTNGRLLSKVQILIPPTDREQDVIAEVLRDMDAEIERLEQQRDKYKAIKQGMMQELLTGKTRLV
jgi:type I restriction enzyme, S subunit